MIEGKSIFRIYHELDLEIDGIEIRLKELKRELDIYIRRSAPKEVKGMTFDKILVGGSIMVPEMEVLNGIARCTMLIGMNEDLLAEKCAAFDGLKTRIRKTERELGDEQNTTYKVFRLGIIEGKPNQIIAQELGYLGEYGYKTIEYHKTKIFAEMNSAGN